ncbi:hypothetical protein BP6252_13772 [Coleophoma cylindrospora]|uniref:Zn(2)-C6 fungal-type domain-containing protein n=1 Tax=Coleophoma cylindrospora TaxID=1849047 RepID=A0A3D8Q6Q2_9HELO|nr:hypothetical protein BP6252_13772 [Coleophoma cylindrospora]
MSQAASHRSPIANTVRTRTGCNPCRRRKKKCDEGKPECAACVRLGIRCEITRPSFHFVNGTTSSFRDHRTIRRQATPEHRSPIAFQRNHIEIAEPSSTYGVDRAGVCSSFPTPDSVTPAEQLLSLARSPPVPWSLQAITPSASEQSVSIRAGTDGTPSHYGSGGFNHASVCATRSDLASSPWNSTSTSTPTAEFSQGRQIDTRYEPVSSLEAWFSSFVDLPPLTVDSLEDGTVIDTEALEAEMEDEFYEMQENLYLQYWRKDMLGKLPMPYKQIEYLLDACPALRPSIISLSACDMAQVRIEVRSRTIDTRKDWFYAPNATHQTHGRRYYNIAKRELAELDYDREDKASILAVLLLFVLVESHIGSFHGAAFHHHAIEHLLSAHYSACQSSAFGRGLISVWTALRAHSWSYRIPFTLLDFNKTLLELGVNISIVLDPFEARAEAVVVNMLQSWRLSLMMLFERYTGRGDMESISSQCCRDVYRRTKPPVMRPPWTPKTLIEDENNASLLNEERQRLDAWHTALPLSQLPIESFSSANGGRPSADLRYSSAIQDLKFQSHQAAINYAYYVVARILQSEAAMDEYLSMKPQCDYPEQGHSETNHWLLTLLRVIAGMDIAACAQQSYYYVSLLEIVKICRLRLPQYSSALCRLADELVQEFTDHCMIYDGPVLISNFRNELKEIEEQKILSKDLFYIMPQNSPDTKKQPSCNRASAAPIMVYGRDRITGKLFCGYISPKNEVR